MNLKTDQYADTFKIHFSPLALYPPWRVTTELSTILLDKIKTLSGDYYIRDNVAIHRSATVEEGVIIKGPVVIGENVFIGSHAYLRGGVFLAPRVSVGPGCEIKTSIVLENSSLAHFNFAGDSIIGSDVNMEAGSIIANHHNDRTDKAIRVRIDGELVTTEVTKFGALIGDGCRIGANAVLSPGTILAKNSIVRRLELICQD